uniref:Uncharacterized protein n=1 Tax=Magallana gigas TaxID=29159 RepID=K1RIV7_MAGGI
MAMNNRWCNYTILKDYPFLAACAIYRQIDAVDSPGNDEINKTVARSLKLVDDSLKEAIVSVRNGSQTISGGSGLGSGSDSGGHCYNSTTNGCVDQCYNICDGDYQSCWTYLKPWIKKASEL